MFCSLRFESKLLRAPNIWHFRARTVVLALGITSLTTPGIQAQAPTAPAQFDVATIKLNSVASGRSRTQPLPGGHLRVENQSLRALIRTAYQIQGFQISGGPSWIASDRYDIEAKSEGNPPLLEVVGPMLRTLLEDRFKLKTHREVRELPVLALSVSKAGMKLRPSEQGNCVPYEPNHPPPARPPGQKHQSICGSISTGRTMLEATGIRMNDLTKTLSYILDRPVIDKTEWKETFDVDLEFVPDEPPSAVPSAGAADTTNLGLTSDGSGPSIMTALQEQLGLSLKSTKGPVEILIIDSAEKPSAN
jgi:uncharacterized protein (TIGR03435 family)